MRCRPPSPPLRPYVVRHNPAITGADAARGIPSGIQPAAAKFAAGAASRAAWHTPQRMVRAGGLRAVLTEYQTHYNTARPHQASHSTSPTTNVTLPAPP